MTTGDDVTPDGKCRDSVWAVIGVTPHKDTFNLQKGGTTDVAAAAAVRLDGFGDESQRGTTKCKNHRRSKK